jgi:hypothetical protein
VTYGSLGNACRCNAYRHLVPWLPQACLHCTEASKIATASDQWIVAPRYRANKKIILTRHNEAAATRHKRGKVKACIWCNEASDRRRLLFIQMNGPKQQFIQRVDRLFGPRLAPFSLFVHSSVCICTFCQQLLVQNKTRSVFIVCSLCFLYAPLVNSIYLPSPQYYWFSFFLSCRWMVMLWTHGTLHA